MEAGEYRRERMHAVMVGYLEQLYDAEHRLTELLPRLADATESEMLKTGYRAGFELTLRRLLRLEQVFRRLDLAPRREPSEVVEAMVLDAERRLREHEPGGGLDVYLISCVQRLQVYGLANYDASWVCANALGKDAIRLMLERAAGDGRRAVDDLWELAERRLH